MEFIRSVWNGVSFSAIAQVAILYVVIYAILKQAKGSRFGQALMGVGILAVTLALFTFVLKFAVLATILRWLLIYLAISTVVIFQPEIRRVLSQMGTFGALDRRTPVSGCAATPEFVVELILELSARKMGALLAFERGISLRGYEETGVFLNADISRELILSIFTPPMPLHDGGVTVRDGRLSAAHCIFPVSSNPDLIVSGMRHRAAAGLSEETDALVIVVSEESGAVSVAHNGRLVRYQAEQCASSLTRWLSKALVRERPVNRMLARLQVLLSKGVRK